jgi:protein-disulfide isomerase
MSPKVSLDTSANLATLVACAAIVFAAWRVSQHSAPPAPATRPPAIERPVGLVANLPESEREQGTGDVVVIEFSDFQCPFCGRYARETFGGLKRDFVDSGKLKYAVRHLPLPNHQFAPRAAAAAQCAADQARYWPMYEKLFSDQHALEEADLREAAKVVGLDQKEFDNCFANKADQRTKQDEAEAKRLGINATPTFLVGRIRPDGKTIRVLAKIHGAQPYAVFKTELQRAATGTDD